MLPYEMIEKIPRFECSNHKQISFSDGFLKQKLLNAIYNKDIICLARGEGRHAALEDIVFHPEVLFDWGEKSMHAFLDDKNEKLRRFCDPDVIDRTLIIEYAYKYGERLQNKINTYRSLKIDGNEYEKIDTLIEGIKCEKNEENLRIVRDWLIYALHTMGERDFAKITSCISCSEGEQRYNVANRFGKGRFNSNYYVIMDSWVRCEEEGRVFKSVNYINTVLEKYGLKWFPNRNNEIMLKYAIFPQRLVGYYLIDRGNIGKYVINNHYIEEWEHNPDFEIGDEIYFEQIIDFDKVGPYNTIYEYNAYGFSVAGRRS